MKCPVCNIDLTMSDRNGIEIDYCPKCRGVWLDRGELDKIIERSASAEQNNRNPAPYKNESYRKYDDDDYKKHQQYKKRKSILGELFDF